MKNVCTLVVTLLLIIYSPIPARAAPILFDWAFNVNGEVYESCTGDVLPDSFDDSAFDWNSGLGVLSIAFDPGSAGAFSIVSFFDHDVDKYTASFYDEYGLTGGSLSPGQTWEIDEPGYVGGDIYDHTLTGSLDNTNAVVPGLEDDVSIALGWTFILKDAEHSILTFYLTQDPSFLSDYNGFFLVQVDAETHESLYLYSTLEIQEDAFVPVPEPASALLLSVGAMGLAIFRKRLLYWRLSTPWYRACRFSDIIR